MREVMRDMFDTLLAGEPPLGVTATQVRQRGLRRRQRRQILAAGGCVAGVIVTASTVVAYTASTNALVVGPATSASAVVDASARPSPSEDASRPVPSFHPTPTPSPSTRTTRPATQFEIPHCSGDGTPKNLVDTDGSVLPDPQRAAQAVLATAATIAPGRTFQLVSAQRVDSSAKNPGAPREYLIVNVSDADGTGSVNLELIPQAGMSAADRAAVDLRAKPFANCTAATVVNFPDGAVGLEYEVAFGTGRPGDSVQHTSYYGPALDINAGTFLTPWDDLSGSRGARTSMPLSTAEVLAICREVALS